MRVVMMGTGPFAVPTFEWLLDSSHEVIALVTRPVPPAVGRRGGKAPENPMRDVALARAVPIDHPESINAPAAVEQLRRCQADLLVVCDYGQILSREALSATPLGGINLHGSLLPKYRGAAPVHWAIWNGELDTGVSVIHMTPRLDGGPILATVRTPIGADETTAELEPRLAELGVPAVQQAMDLLASWDGQSPLGEPQDPTLVSKAPRLTKRHGEIDWTQSAERIRNQVRALKPWPGTYTTWQRGPGEPLRLILDWVSIAPERPVDAEPGQVIVSDDRRLVVATGGGAVSLDRVQPSGKRVMETAEFQRGYRIPVETRLGAK